MMLSFHANDAKRVEKWLIKSNNSTFIFFDFESYTQILLNFLQQMIYTERRQSA